MRAMQVEASRRPAPSSGLAETYVRSRLKEPRRVGPFKDQVERDLANNATILSASGSCSRSTASPATKSPTPGSRRSSRPTTSSRAIFAFNSVNVEGWGLYAEAEVKPYLPLDGQLAALQSRLARAARAILDPGTSAAPPG
jgi:hypothetical protein